MEFPEELEGRFHDAVLVADRSRFLYYKAWMYHPRGRSERKEVIVKIPDAGVGLDGDGTETSFERQAALHSRLAHPNIARMYSFSLKPYPYIAMEFVKGKTLEECASGFSHEVCAEMMVGLTSAVVHMHERGVYHGDFCAENIMVPENPRLAKLIDFGCSEDISPGKISSALAYQKKTEDFFSLMETCTGVLDSSQLRVLSSFPEVIVPRVLAGQKLRK